MIIAMNALFKAFSHRCITKALSESDLLKMNLKLKNVSQLRTHYGLFINGKYVNSESYIPIENPANQEIICSVAAASVNHVDMAVDSAKRSFDSGSWSKSDHSFRFKVITKIASLLEKRLDSFALMESLQTGRPIREMKAQLSRIPEWLEYHAAVIRTHEDRIPPFKGGQMLNMIRRVPLGACGLITPFNHPLLIAIKKMAPALAAGNSVVVKPSEMAPVSVLEFAQLCSEAGLPDGVLNVVNGHGHITGKALAENKLLAKLDITGGTETGRLIAANAGKNLITCTAELGGKTPVIIFDDANFDDAINGACFASFIASGQTCVTGSRILVQASIYEEFIQKFIQKVEKLKLGDPLDPKTDMGPVISKAQIEKIDRFVESARNEGAKILTGGKQKSCIGYYYEPTVIGDCTPEMTVVKEEIFGPVVCVMPFESEEDAINLANDSNYGLAAGVWSNDLKRAHRMADELHVGICWINGHHHNDPSSVWGGLKDSGIGVENGIEAFNSYTQLKSTVINYGKFSDWFGSRDATRYG